MISAAGAPDNRESAADRRVVLQSAAYSSLSEAVAAEMAWAGLHSIRWRRLGPGAVALHLGTT
jgi:hypothetical protein